MRLNKFKKTSEKRIASYILHRRVLASTVHHTCVVYTVLYTTQEEYTDDDACG